MIEYVLRNYNNNLSLTKNLEYYRNIPLKFEEEYIYNLDNAINRIINAINNKEYIGIFTDSDSDGINSNIILMKSLRKISNCIHSIVCDREKGYGIQKEYYDEMNRLGVTLVITADIGISNREEIEYGKSLGIDTIVTDHHPIVNAPNCIIINPENKENINMTKYCGAGLAYILMKNLYNRLFIEFDEDNDIISHATIGTIGDLVSLTKNNYFLVKRGLKTINNSNSKSLKWIMNFVNKYSKQDIPSATDIAFNVVPLMNSLNRVSLPKKAVDFFLSNDSDEVETLGKYIIEKNKIRKNMQIDAIIEAIKIIKKRKLTNSKILFLDLNIRKTFAGLVASYITSDFLHIPSIVVSKDDKGNYYGSGRSIKTCDFTNLILKLKPYCIKTGGHPAAFGISFKEENYDIIKKLINEFAEEQDKLGNLKNIVYIDKEILLDDINDEFIEQIKTLEPYGMDNPPPIFITKGVIISDLECRNFNTFMSFENIGSVFSFTDKETYKGIAFKRDLNGEFAIGDVVDITYEITYNKTMLIKNIKLSEME